MRRFDRFGCLVAASIRSRSWPGSNGRCLKVRGSRAARGARGFDRDRVRLGARRLRRGGNADAQRGRPLEGQARHGRVPAIDRRRRGGSARRVGRGPAAARAAGAGGEDARGAPSRGDRRGAAHDAADVPGAAAAVTRITGLSCDRPPRMDRVDRMDMVADQHRAMHDRGGFGRVLATACCDHRA